MPSYSTSRHHAGGFTYLGILFAVMFIGIGLAAAGTVWSVGAQRTNEKELLFVGRSFRRAIESYYLHGPAGARQYPQTLDDLLEDERTGILQRHLRKIYLDPMTHRRDWNLITTGDGIIGISSNSQKSPIKRRNFPADEQGLTDAACYCDWRFIYLPQLQGE